MSLSVYVHLPQEPDLRAAVHKGVPGGWQPGCSASLDAQHEAGGAVAVFGTPAHEVVRKILDPHFSKSKSMWIGQTWTFLLIPNISFLRNKFSLARKGNKLNRDITNFVRHYSITYYFNSLRSYGTYPVLCNVRKFNKKKHLDDCYRYQKNENSLSYAIWKPPGLCKWRLISKNYFRLYFYFQ